MGRRLKGTFIAALMAASDKYTLGMVGCRNCDTLGGDVTASLSLFLQGLTWNYSVIFKRTKGGGSTSRSGCSCSIYINVVIVSEALKLTGKHVGVIFH